ncbi:MAG TPA: peptide-N4-asparagine amidase [Acidobacteriaceae bacterium]
MPVPLFSLPGWGRSSALTASLLLSACVMSGQVTVVPSTPQVGSSNPATAAPNVPRPHTRPCVVTLFQNLAFDNFTPATFDYTPPASCPGPWAKVVFTADFTVTEGRQFDRTAAFYLGHANIYYGTTAEPRAALSPSWHVERDVTDLSAIFKSTQTGEANIGNFVGVSGGVTYNGIIYANAALEFYPADFRDRAPRTPEIVVPVNGTGGDAGTLNTTTDQITQTLNLPKNVESAYLDVIAQNQSGDEFWYFCVPNDQTSNLESCGGTAFRETEIWLDGKPAGVAPAYPWIFTGGIDPYLWEPVTDVQTLEFVPYRVDLTPFAGVLSDGGTHTVAVSVFNANSYFLATANLLVFTDHGRGTVTGGVISNTLADAPVPVVTENITTGTGPTYTGTIDTSSSREFTIRGWVNTSHGRVETTVTQQVGFTNNQQFDVSGTTDVQNVAQLTTVDSSSVTKEGWLETKKEQHFRYPLTINFSFVVNSDNSEDQTTTVKQGFDTQERTSLNGWPLYDSKVHEETNATDTLPFDASGNFLGPMGSKTSQTYTWRNSLGTCYSRTIKAAAQVLTAVDDDGDCHERR